MREILTMLDLHQHELEEAKGRELYVTTNCDGHYIVCYDKAPGEGDTKGGHLVAELYLDELEGA